MNRIFLLWVNIFNLRKTLPSVSFTRPSVVRAKLSNIEIILKILIDSYRWTSWISKIKILKEILEYFIWILHSKKRFLTFTLFKKFYLLVSRSSKSFVFYFKFVISVLPLPLQQPVIFIRLRSGISPRETVLMTVEQKEGRFKKRKKKEMMCVCAFEKTKTLC